MKIIHLMSQKYLTGAEVYATGIAEKQIANGNEVTLVSDTINVPTNIEFVAMPISKHRYIIRLLNAFKLARYCKKNNIDVIHAHSRAACWAAYLTKKLNNNIAYVVTLHDMQKPHRMARRWNIYGENMIAVSEVIKDSFVNNLHIPEEQINVIRNGL